MEFVRRTLTEWPLLPVRLVRTRLGVWWLVLVGALWWLQRGDPRADPVGIAVLAGTLGAVVCVAGLAASTADRAALAHRLLHPTTPAAITTGRWLGAVSGATLAICALSGYAAWSTHAASVGVGAPLAGVVAAVSASASALALVLVGGHPAAVLAFLWFLFVSTMSPEAMLGLGRHGVPATILAGMLEVGPSVWRYREVASGNLGAAAHAVLWVGAGLSIATWRVARRGGRRL